MEQGDVLGSTKREREGQHREGRAQSEEEEGTTRQQVAMKTGDREKWGGAQRSPQQMITK